MEEVKQEDRMQLEIKPEIIMPMLHQTLEDVEVKQEYGSDEICDDVVDECNDEDQDEMNSDKCDNRTNTQIEEESSKDEDDSPLTKRRNNNLSKMESKASVLRMQTVL